MAYGAGEFLGVGQVEHLVGGVGIREGATHAEGDNLSVWVHALELFQEWDRTTLTIASCRLIEEGTTSLVDSLSQPRLWLLLAPAVASVGSRGGDFSVVGDRRGQFLSQLLDGFLVVLQG